MTLISLVVGDASRVIFTHQVVTNGVAVARRRNREFVLWQRRYWEHTIRDDGDFARHVDYIHFNPVKHGLVSRPRDWPYSSFHLYVRRGILPADWAGEIASTHERFGERNG
jgi:putative transposase